MRYDVLQNIQFKCLIFLVYIMQIANPQHHYLNQLMNCLKIKRFYGKRMDKVKQTVTLCTILNKMCAFRYKRYALL